MHYSEGLDTVVGYMLHIGVSHCLLITFFSLSLVLLVVQLFFSAPHSCQCNGAYFIMDCYGELILKLSFLFDLTRPKSVIRQ